MCATRLAEIGTILNKFPKPDPQRTRFVAFQLCGTPQVIWRWGSMGLILYHYFPFSWEEAIIS